MICTIIQSDDLSVAIDNIENVTEAGLRERFGFVEGEENSREAEYELTENDGKRVHAFYMEDGYQTDAIWVVEG